MFFHNQEVYNVSIHDHERLRSWYFKWFRYHFQSFALTITFILYRSSMKFTDVTSATSKGKFYNESASCLVTISVEYKGSWASYIWYVTCHDSQPSLCQLDPGGCETLFMYRVQIPTSHCSICEIYFQKFLADLERVGKIKLNELGGKVMKATFLLYVFVALRTSYCCCRYLISFLFVLWTRWGRK